MPEKATYKHFIQKRLRFLAWLSIVAFALGQMGRWYWVLELFSHFPPYYGLAFVIGAIVAKHWWERATFIICSLALCFWAVTPFTPKLYSEGRNSIHALSYNLLVSNPQKKLESEWLLQDNSDILFLTEITPHWASYLRPLEQREHCALYEDTPFGIALYSRRPLQSCEIRYTSNSSTPYIRASLESGLIIYGLHLPPPITQTLAQERNTMLNELAHLIQQEQEDVMVLGDMNMTAFSPYFRNFTSKAGLHLVFPRGKPTWKPGFIGIDHALVSQPDFVLGAGAYEWHTSDHRAIWINYAQ